LGRRDRFVAIDDQGQPMVHSNDGFGKRKKQAGSIPPFFHQPL
jgi:hypothetical protein